MSPVFSIVFFIVFSIVFSSIVGDADVSTNLQIDFYGTGEYLLGQRYLKIDRNS